MMETTYAYFAGLIDGEGHIALAKRSDRPDLKPFIQVSMTDEAVVRSLQAAFGGSVWFKGREKNHYKDQWRWRVWHKQARECLEKISPYLRVKREDANRVLVHASVDRRKGGPKNRS